MAEKTEAELIKLYLNGDESTLDELIKRHLNLVYNFIYRLTGDELASTDLTQDTFIKVWRNLAKFQTDKNFKTWLMTIARRTSIDWLRQRRPLVFSKLNLESKAGDPAADFGAELPDPKPWPEEIFAQGELKDRLEKSLAGLSLADRSLLLLHLTDGFSLAEIAEILGQSPNTVKSQYRRARLKLQALLLLAP